MDKIRRLFSREGRYPLWIFSLTAAAVNLLCYYVPKLITFSFPKHYMEIGADALIPLIPATIIIYAGAFFQWLVYYLRTAKADSLSASRALTAEVISKLVCALCFIIYPTTVNRPQASGTDFFSVITNLMFFVDVPTCIFPSIHCLQSWLCMRFALGRRDLSVPRKCFSVLFTLAVCVSTVTMKQHALVDIPAGILLAEICLAISPRLKMTGKLREKMDAYLRGDNGR